MVRGSILRKGPAFHAVCRTSSARRMSMIRNRARLKPIIGSGQPRTQTSSTHTRRDLGDSLVQASDKGFAATRLPPHKT